MIKVTLYTREGCVLCEQAKEDLKALQSEIPHRLIEIDIESDPALLKRFNEVLPVVQIGPYKLEALFTKTDLLVALAAARDGLQKAQPRSNISRNQAIRLNRAVLFLSRHWLAIFNLFTFAYVGLPIAAPILMKLGATRPAIVIYRIYSILCHQLAFRSWFLFGEQSAYPLASAGTSLTPYSIATGLDSGDIFGAVSFIGNERLGYKVALCQRDVAIWGGILLAGLLFALLRDRLKPLPITLWLIFGIIPIALDAGSQFLTQFPILSSLSRESTPFLRTLTGGLFAVCNIWMAYPYIEESMTEIRIQVTTKLAGVGDDGSYTPKSPATR
jgi:uncharacterized membrane protein